MRQVEIEKVLIGDYITQICEPGEDASWEGVVMKVIAVDDPFIVVDIFDEDTMRICNRGPIRETYNTRKTAFGHLSKVYMDAMNFKEYKTEGE